MFPLRRFISLIKHHVKQSTRVPSFRSFLLFRCLDTCRRFTKLLHVRSLGIQVCKQHLLWGLKYMAILSVNITYFRLFGARGNSFVRFTFQGFFRLFARSSTCRRFRLVDVVVALATSPLVLLVQQEGHVLLVSRPSRHSSRLRPQIAWTYFL